MIDVFLPCIIQARTILLFYTSMNQILLQLPWNLPQNRLNTTDTDIIFVSLPDTE